MSRRCRSRPRPPGRSTWSTGPARICGFGMRRRRRRASRVAPGPGRAVRVTTTGLARTALPTRRLPPAPSRCSRARAARSRWTASRAGRSTCRACSLLATAMRSQAARCRRLRLPLSYEWVRARPAQAPSRRSARRSQTTTWPAVRYLPSSTPARWCSAAPTPTAAARR